MCPLKREQARRETQQWVMRRLPTADSIVEIGRKVGHELSNIRIQTSGVQRGQGPLSHKKSVTQKVFNALKTFENVLCVIKPIYIL